MRPKLVILLDFCRFSPLFWPFVRLFVPSVGRCDAPRVGVAMAAEAQIETRIEELLRQLGLTAKSMHRPALCGPQPFVQT